MGQIMVENNRHSRCCEIIERISEFLGAFHVIVLRLLNFKLTDYSPKDVENILN